MSGRHRGPATLALSTQVLIRQPAVSVVAVLVVLLAACGGESDEEKAIEAVATGLVADPSLTSYDITQAEGQCLGEYLVDELGADAVLELENDTGGILENVRPEQVTALGDGLDACVAEIDQITRDLLTENLPNAAERADTPGSISVAQAECVADAIVGEVPLSRLITIGVANEADTVTPLTVAEATSFAAAYVDCTDARADVLAEVAAQGATPEQVACFDQRITDADLVERFAAGFLGEPEPDTFATAAAECF